MVSCKMSWKPNDIYIYIWLDLHFWTLQIHIHTYCTPHCTSRFHQRLCPQRLGGRYMEVSWNRGTPKSSMLMGVLHSKPTTLRIPIYGNPRSSLSEVQGSWSWDQWKAPRSELLFQGRLQHGPHVRKGDRLHQMGDSSRIIPVVSRFTAHSAHSAHSRYWDNSMNRGRKRHHLQVAYLIWLNSEDNWVRLKICGNTPNPVV